MRTMYILLYDIIAYFFTAITNPIVKIVTTANKTNTTGTITPINNALLLLFLLLATLPVAFEPVEVSVGATDEISVEVLVAVEVSVRVLVGATVVDLTVVPTVKDSVAQ